MTSAENSISEPPNLKIFCWMLPPEPPPPPPPPYKARYKKPS